MQTAEQAAQASRAQKQYERTRQEGPSRMRGTYTNASNDTCCTHKHNANAMLQTGREAPSRSCTARILMQTAEQDA